MSVSVLSVRLSVTEVHWRIIANLGFKFRSNFTAHCGRRAACRAASCGSSRAMLASARLSCYPDELGQSVPIGVFLLLNSGTEPQDNRGFGRTHVLLPPNHQHQSTERHTEH